MNRARGNLEVLSRWETWMLKTRTAWIGAPMAAALLLGCGPSRPDLAEVSGQVLIDGQPLSIGNIKFVPENGRPSWGKIDASGRFTLTCYEPGDGAIPGTHRVQVSAIEIIGSTKAKWHAPKKYADFRTSGLTAEIQEPTDNLTIELTWDGGKPFIEN